MIKRLAFYIFTITFTVSCSVEKINLSPVADDIVNSASITGNPSRSYDQKTNQVFYSSEITGLLGSFPKFRNDAVNKEISELKIHLNDYIQAMSVYNMNGMEKSYHKYEKSYKKLQKLRNFLNSDEDQVLNRYLVRIKSNMSFLENSVPNDSSRAEDNF